MGQKLQESTRKELEEKQQEEGSAEPAEEETQEETPEEKKRWGSGAARIKKIRAYASDGAEQRIFRTGESIRFKLDYSVREKVQDAVFGIGIFNRDGVQCYGTNTRIDKLPEFSLEKSGTAEIFLEKADLLPGEYLLDFAIETGDGIPVDYYREAYKIEMISNIGDVGISRIEHKWNI